MWLAVTKSEFFPNCSSLAALLTRMCFRGRVNFFIAYSGTREIIWGMRSKIEGSSHKYSSSGEESVDLSGSLFTRDELPLDLLIRTSGATRLSDFMLWQCSDQTELVFLDCFWPQFGAWQLAFSILQWRSRVQYNIPGSLVSRISRNWVAGVVFIFIPLLLFKDMLWTSFNQREQLSTDLYAAIYKHVGRSFKYTKLLALKHQSTRPCQRWVWLNVESFIGNKFRTREGHMSAFRLAISCLLPS